MSSSAFIDAIEREILARGIASARSLVGCTDDQIHEIEDVHGKPLPELYELFMRKAGVRAGVLFQGTEIFYPDVLGLRDAARELLEEAEAPQLPTDALVFSMHQGYQFLFFDQRSADPPVMWYFEGRGFSQMSPTFSSFLETEVKSHGDLVERGVLPLS